MAKKKKATRAKAKPKARKSSARAKTSSRRNTAAKRTPAAKAAPFKAPKLSPASTPRTKSQIVMTLSEQTGLTRKDVTNIFSALTDVIGNDMGKRGCGLFTVPGLMKIRRVNKPATKARKGINPFTGEETVFKAKPARNVVKVRPLKALKDMC
jgi:nucleoid DNA-binding protein